jgi:hypothetical protein
MAAAIYPEEQAKVQEELDAMFGRDKRKYIYRILSTYIAQAILS